MTPRGLRNNNPGNIEYNSITSQYLGCVGSDGRFCQFDSMTHGLRALGVLLLTYQRLHGIRTIRAAINRWAPPSENDTGAYVNAVASGVAAALRQPVSPDDPLDFNDPPTLRALIVAIGRHENGPASFDHYCTAEMIDAAVGMVLGVRPQDVVVEPSPAPAPEPTLEEPKPMLPALIPILLNALIPQIPVLAQAFGKTGEKTAAKVQAAASTLQVITQAVGAANEQEAVQRVTTDPAARQAAQSALLSDPTFLSLIEVGGGIEAARRVAFDPAQAPFYKTGAFWISLVLLAFPMMLAVDIFFVHPDAYKAELRTQVVTAFLVAITVVGAFWLGTTMSSQRKTEILANRE